MTRLRVYYEQNDGDQEEVTDVSTWTKPYTLRLLKRLDSGDKVEFFKTTLNPDGSTPPPTTPPPPPTSSTEVVYNLPFYRDSKDTRLVFDVQQKLPNGTWSSDLRYNWDTGAVRETVLHPSLLTTYGYTKDGLPHSDSKAKTETIRIKGFQGEFQIPVRPEDKDHYTQIREDGEPARYPLLRIRDLMGQLSFVQTSKTFTIRTKGVPIPELNKSGIVSLPDFASRPNTPTTGWQWLRVKYSNPNDASKNIEDWQGFPHTGDRRFIIKKESVVDKIGVPQTATSDSDEFDAVLNMTLLEANPVTTITNMAVTSRKESASTGGGGDARNIGWGLSVLSKYTLVLWDLHRALVPV